MSKILFIGDIHLKISSLAVGKRFLEWVYQYASSNKVDLIVNLGDSFNDHAIIRSEILSEFATHVRQMTSICPYVYVLGNHDAHRPNDSSYHALQVFKRQYDRFIVVDRVVNQPEYGITFIPYMPDHADFPLQTQPICVAHQSFVGCDFGGYRPEGGVDADSVSADLIISGHIHMRQTFGKVHYPGTPYSQGMKDCNQIKGLSLLDTDTLQISLIECPLPRWRLHEVTVDKDVQATLADIGSLSREDCHVVVLSGPRREIASLLLSETWKQLCKTHTVSLRTKYTDSVKVDRVKIKATGTVDIVYEYIDRVYSGSLDKEAMKRALADLMQENAI